ncbi:MAG: bifunctional diaminohydroxyphosphoribosylaminopyrimidine deaminase/5-amino-6-(5-phosphoribosylamino)uracil reductase RibD [Porphyromonadaceae bacterium]|nr:bifunctional diaminohydroxyphosphoribosylaminopyrimidine deaminase/5-amino-6-(5-phosphoribosylamino)uracil reductase RibD [Porphyromonadaceae bacterium]
MTEKEREDCLYMRRCLQLAAYGRGWVSPNPMVGAVIVYDGKIIGEGWHRQFGQGHAEVNAIASVRQPELLSRSTLYVSLEPCSHYGKTPPCSRLILEKKIPRVVVGCLDPFPQVSGRGVTLLRDGGVEVRTDVLAEECRVLNIAFMTAHTLQRPYVLLKWAQSRDGFVDSRPTPESPAYRFSDKLTSLWVQRLRAECDAVLVGGETVRRDNPRLTVREWPCRCTPLRVVLSRHGEGLTSSYLFTDGLPTEVFTDRPVEAVGDVRFTTLDFASPVLPQLLAALYKEGITNLLVEGGPTTLQSFIDAGLWDEARVETAPVDLGRGVAAPRLPHVLPFFSIRYGERRVERFRREE